MYDAIIDEIDGRRIRVGDHWLSDFASCNYLGFDLEPEIMDAIDVQVRRWGTHPSWSRLLGNPALYPQIEEQLTELLGAPDTLVLPTITHIHMSVIPILAGQGTDLPGLAGAQDHLRRLRVRPRARARRVRAVPRRTTSSTSPSCSAQRPPARPGWSAWTASTA